MSVQTLFALLTLAAQVLLGASVVGFFVSTTARNFLRTYVTEFGYLISFFIVLFATLGSLYFSDIVGWEPCVLCWYQRIAMYPLVAIFALGVWRRDNSARVYGLVLSCAGLLIALYQIYLQIAAASGQTLSGLCSAVGAVSCSEIYLREFGYITFPVMSATVFVFIIFLQLVRRVIQ